MAKIDWNMLGDKFSKDRPELGLCHTLRIEMILHVQLLDCRAGRLWSKAFLAIKVCLMSLGSVATIPFDQTASEKNHIGFLHPNRMICRHLKVAWGVATMSLS